MSTFLRLSQSKEHDLDGPILPSPIGGGNGYFQNDQSAGRSRPHSSDWRLSAAKARPGASFTKGGKKPYTLDDPHLRYQGTPTDPAVWGWIDHTWFERIHRCWTSSDESAVAVSLLPQSEGDLFLASWSSQLQNRL